MPRRHNFKGLRSENGAAQGPSKANCRALPEGDSLNKRWENAGLKAEEHFL